MCAGVVVVEEVCAGVEVEEEVCAGVVITVINSPR